jgi:hypothetical protein
MMMQESPRMPRMSKLLELLGSHQPTSSGQNFTACARNWSEGLQMQMVAGAEMKKLKQLLGGYGVEGTSDVSVTRDLIIKVKGGSTEFTASERELLVRALEWCTKQLKKRPSEK